MRLHLSAAEVLGPPATVSVRPEILVTRPGSPRIDGVTVHTTDRVLIAAGWTVLRFTRGSSPTRIVSAVQATYDRLLRADRTSQGGFREKIGGWPTGA